MRALTILIGLLLMIGFVGCGSDSGGGGDATVNVAENINGEYLGGNYIINDGDDSIFIQTNGDHTYKAWYSHYWNEKVYTVEGFYEITATGYFKTTVITDLCGRGNELLTYSRTDSETIYLENVEYYKTETPAEQWTFYTYDTECF